MKNWSVRTKILVFVELILLVVLSSTTFFHIQQLRKSYVTAFEWRSAALAQNIIAKIADIYALNAAVSDTLSVLSIDCRKLYESDPAFQISHVGVIDKTNTMVAHNDKAFWGIPVSSPALLEHLREPILTTILDGTTYHTLVPVVMRSDGAFLGTIDIGFPKHLMDSAIRAALLHNVGMLFSIAVIVLIALILLLHLLIISPVKNLVAFGHYLAEGDIRHSAPIRHSQDELGRLHTIFSRITHYVRSVAEVASHVSEGVLDSEVQVRSQHDVLGKSMQHMLDYLRDIARVATHVAEGDLSATIQVRSADDMFGRILHSMTEGLRTLILQIRISAEEIVSTGKGITALIQHNTGLVGQVHTSAEGVMSTMHQMGSSVEEVAHNMETLSSSVEETSTAISEMRSSVTHIASNSSELAEQTHQTIHSLQQTLLSLESIVENMETSKQYSQDTMQDAHNGQDAVEQVMYSMETIQETVTTAVDAITVFEQRSEEIGTILDVIRDITDQTGLLALNASIIAAQAGEHGRGFAVVADEIRNLASGVGSSTKDIAEIVQSLQQDTRRVVLAIHEGVQDVDQGIERTRQAQEMLQKISRSAHQSSALVTTITETLHTLMLSSQEVSEAMAKVSMMTDEITTATTEQDASTRQIHVAIGQINDMTSQIQRATVGQTDGIHHVLNEISNVSVLINQSLESSQNIQDATGELSSQASMLLHSVDRFTLPEMESIDALDVVEH